MTTTPAGAVNEFAPHAILAAAEVPNVPACHARTAREAADAADLGFPVRHSPPPVYWDSTDVDHVVAAGVDRTSGATERCGSPETKGRCERDVVDDVAGIGNPARAYARWSSSYPRAGDGRVAGGRPGGGGGGHTAAHGARAGGPASGTEDVIVEVELRLVEDPPSPRSPAAELKRVSQVGFQRRACQCVRRRRPRVRLKRPVHDLGDLVCRRVEHVW